MPAPISYKGFSIVPLTLNPNADQADLTIVKRWQVYRNGEQLTTPIFNSPDQAKDWIDSQTN